MEGERLVRRREEARARPIVVPAVIFGLRLRCPVHNLLVLPLPMLPQGIPSIRVGLRMTGLTERGPPG